MYYILVPELPWMLDKITSVAREMRNPTPVPVGSTFHAKKLMKVKGVMDRSLQSRTVRTRSSILRIVLGSKTYLAPSVWSKNRNYFHKEKVNKQMNKINKLMKGPSSFVEENNQA